MEFEDLPKEVQENITNLKHGAYTIETDIVDALDAAENLEDFQCGVQSSMRNLANEALDAIATFCGYKNARSQMDEMTTCWNSTIPPEFSLMQFTLVEQKNAIIGGKPTSYYTWTGILEIKIGDTAYEVDFEIEETYNYTSTIICARLTDDLDHISDHIDEITTTSQIKIKEDAEEFLKSCVVLSTIHKKAGIGIPLKIN